MTATIPVFPSGDGAKITDRQDKLVRLEAAAQKRLTAERNVDRNKKLSKEARDTAVPLMQELGVGEVAVDDEGITLIETTATTVDQDAIERYVRRYYPDAYDIVFPVVRSFDMEALRALVGQNIVGKAALSHITTAPGEPQLRRFKVK